MPINKHKLFKKSLRSSLFLATNGSTFKSGVKNSDLTVSNDPIIFSCTGAVLQLNKTKHLIRLLPQNANLYII